MNFTSFRIDNYDQVITINFLFYSILVLFCCLQMYFSLWEFHDFLGKVDWIRFYGSKNGRAKLGTKFTTCFKDSILLNFRNFQ